MTGRVTLDHVVIAVSDWERSNAFYRDVCGAELVRLDGPPPVRWRYRFGDVVLNVHGPGMDPQPVARIPAAPVARNGAAGPGLSVYFATPTGRCWSSSPTPSRRRADRAGRRRAWRRDDA